MSCEELINNEQDVLIRVPMTFKKHSGRKQIIMPNDQPNNQTPGNNYHDAIAIAISRAHYWKRLLDESRYDSIAEMAQAFKVNRYYMARILRLTLLAPDIIEAILSGNEPDGFSLNQLVGEIPNIWTEQRAKFKFPPAPKSGA